MKAYRQANLVRIANKAERKLKANTVAKNVQANPQVVAKAIEAGSWIEDDLVQEMWAGLIASACTEDGKDDSNLVFVQSLGQLTATEARLIKFLCENSKFYRDSDGWVYAGTGRWNLLESRTVGWRTI